MIIRYKFPQFEQLILDGEKIHTFREDAKKRWRAGMSIQHYMYSYMNPKSFKFLENECMAIQDVLIVHVANAHKYLLNGVEYRFFEMAIVIDQTRIYLDDQCLPIIKNDGLTKEEFISFFVPNVLDLRDSEDQWNELEDFVEEKSVWNGRLIHWTEKLY